MKQLRLFWHLLRYRVAIMLILFLLLSLSLHQKLTTNLAIIILGCISLALSYVSATSINDIADARIDAINHPKSIGRPLITGEAKKSDLIILFSLASIGALIFALFINWWALLIIGCSILINVLYSLPPIRLSYRTFLAPIILGVAYVGLPFMLGIVISKSSLNLNNLLWILGLYIMFIGRIILKDFRDRKGDSKFHKPTFLLKYGKTATCVFSYIAIIIGGSLLIAITYKKIWLSIIIALYIISIIIMLRRLQLSPEGEQEQLSIGVGAKMGNGLLITLLCAFALEQSGVNSKTTILITSFLTLIFVANYINFLINPKSATIGYKG